MTRVIAAAAVAGALLLGGCDSLMDKGPPPKRQPGSWSQKVEIVKVEGKDADKIKAQMQASLAMMGNISICVTPDMVAKEDPVANLKKFNSDGSCKVDKQDFEGKNVSFSGTCKGPGGEMGKIDASGTLSPTAQDFTVSIDATTKVEIKTHAVRNGDCTAKDLKIPAGMGGM